MNNLTSLPSIEMYDSVASFNHSVPDDTDQCLRDAFQLMNQATTRIQEAMQLKEERLRIMVNNMMKINEEKLKERIEETTRVLERGLQEKLDVALRIMEASLKKRLEGMESKMEKMTMKTYCTEDKEESSILMEERMEALEASVQKALVTVFPKVEALVTQLQNFQSPESHSSSTIAISPASDNSLGLTDPPPIDTDVCTTVTSVTREHPSSTFPTDTPPLITATPSASDCGRNSVTTTVTSDTREYPSNITRHSDLTTTTNISSSPTRSPLSTSLTSRLTRRELNKELIRSAHNGRVETLAGLLDAGAKVNARDHEGRTALHRAAFKGHADVVSLLLGRGGDVHKKEKNGFTALHFASVSDARGAVLSLLIAAGADVNAKNVAKETPLHYASSHSNEAAVMALLTHGARRALKNILGMTAADCASAPSIRRLLSS